MLTNNYNGFVAPANKLKKLAVLFIVGTFLLVAFVFAKNSSFIVIETDGSAGNKVTYELTDPSGKAKELKGSAGKKRIRVGVGDFGVVVKSDTKSYFAAVKTKGFFRTSSVKASPEPEKKRTFVGNNPSLCMKYLVTRLISYACSDTFDNVSVHIPATATTPTYVLKNPNKTTGGSVEGTVKTKEGILVLLKQNAAGDSGASHTIYTLGDDLGTSGARGLTDLNIDTSYLLTNYREGFLAYSLARGEALYYSGLSAKPELIKFEKPKDSSLSATSLSTKGNTIAVLYTQPADQRSKNNGSEVHIKSTSGWKVLPFKHNYTEAVLCGTDKLCAVANETMDVYDVRSEKPELLYSVKRVISLRNTSTDLLIIRTSDVLRFDADKRTGFIDYSFGDYSFAGIQPEPSGYILSLANNKGKKVALFVDGQAPNDDSIDKKVAELLKLAEVKDISTYGKFIFVSPDTGDLVYVPTTDSFGYDPARVQAANAKINQEVSQIGIDPSKYTVINTIK